MNIIKSTLSLNCPQCRSSKLFKGPFNFKNPLNMYERCSVCNQKFEPEPGFYIGAMFVSYGLSTFMLLIPALILVFGFGWNVNNVMLLVVTIVAISFFKILRLSRSIWIHINVKYDTSYGGLKGGIVNKNNSY